jgi:outer membrane protein
MLALLLSLITADTLNLTLEQALTAAHRQSPTAADARLDSVSGRDAFWRGWSAVMPTLSGSGSVGWRLSRYQNPYSADTTFRDTLTGSVGASVGLSQVLFDAGAYGAVARGIAADELGRVQGRSKTSQLEWNVKTGYYGMQKAYGLFEIAGAAVKQADDNLFLAQQKLKFGKATQLDLMRAQTYLHQARLNQMDAEKVLLAANEALKVLLGVEDQSVIKPEAVDTTPSATVFASFDAFWRQVGIANPALELARRTRQVAQLNRRLAYGEMLPSLAGSVSHSFGSTSLPASREDLHNNSSTSFGLSMSLPIFNIKNIVLSIREANTAVAQAEVTLRTSELQLRQSALSSYLNYEQALRQVSYAAENVRLNQELYRLAQEQYRLGQMTLIDLFNVETTLAQAQTSYLSALSDVKIQQAQIDYLLGK